MTEQEITDLGFEKVIVTNEESQNGYDYYYYMLKLVEGLSLRSSDSVDSTGTNWFVLNDDWPKVKITRKEDVAILIELAHSW